MSSLSSFIASYLVNAIWEVALIGVAGWMASRLLKRLGPQAEHVGWVATLVLAVVTPALPVLRWVWYWPLKLLFMAHVGSAHSSITFVTAENAHLNSAGIHVLPAMLLWPLLTVYVGSVFYFAVRFAWSLRCTAVLLREARAVSLTAEQEAVWLRCRREFSLEAAQILSSTEIAGPVTVGWREPVLLVPEEFTAECATEDFLVALAHECAHMKRHDFRKNLLYEIASLAIAFHPVAWLLKAQIAETREMVCDGMATDGLIDSRRYTHALLRLATMVATRVAMSSRVYPSHAIGIFDANILEKRIMMMNLKKKHVSSVLKYGLVTPAMLFLLSAAVGGAAMAVVIEPPPPVTQTADKTQPYGQVYHVGKDVSAPVLVFSKEPEFPKAASENKQDRFGGNCLIGLVVDSMGAVHDVHVKRSLRPDFDAQAVEAVQQYRFKPAMRSGEPVAAALTVEVNFQKF